MPFAGCSKYPLILSITLVLSVAGCRSAGTACHSDATVEITEHSGICDSDSSVQALAVLPPSSNDIIQCSLHKVGDCPERLISLTEAQRTAVSKSEVIRLGTVPYDGRATILTNPQAVASSFDVRIRRSGVLYGDRSSAAALTDFATRLNFDGTWGHNELVQNSLLGSGGVPLGGVLNSDTSGVNFGLSKQLLTGGNVSATQSVQYLQDNVPNRLFPSAYSGAATIQFQQPILAGAGTNYNSVAGPLNGSLRGITGVQQGFVIARINEQISAIEFQRQLQELLHDVEIVYWRLKLHYELTAILTDAVRDAGDSVAAAERRSKLGEKGGSTVDVSDAKLLYLDLQSQRSIVSKELLEQESLLRRLLNMEVSDDALLRPEDDFFNGDLIVDFQSGFGSAMTFRTELLVQREQIRSLQLQLDAAQNVNRARLDFVSSYSANAFGDQLLGPSNPPGSLGFGSAAATELRGGQTGWTLGFQYERPLGLKLGKLQVANIELRVAKANAVLRAQESEIEHEVIGRLRQLEHAWEQIVNAKDRAIETEKRLDAIKSRHKADPSQISINDVSLAQRARFDAESQVRRSLLDYSMAMAEWHHVCGNTIPASSVAIVDGFVVVVDSESQGSSGFNEVN